MSIEFKNFKKKNILIKKKKKKLKKKMVSKNPVAHWDFTLKEEAQEVGEIKEKLTLECKKWCFQLEKGKENDYLHYQGRISLKNKSRKIIGLLGKTCHWSITSKNSMDNDFYCTKEETRVNGPWKNTDKYIPRQIREIEMLWPWQQRIVDDATNWNTRKINLVHCPEGNTGKSTLAGWLRAYNIGRVLPPVNDYKDLLRIVCACEPARLYVFDMPRSMKKEKLCQFYSAIETIKDGYAYDDRYSFKEKYFDCPNIWIFTNSLPDITYLSMDRWTIWRIGEENNLIIRCTE